MYEFFANLRAAHFSNILSPKGVFTHVKSNEYLMKGKFEIFVLPKVSNDDDDDDEVFAIGVSGIHSLRITAEHFGGGALHGWESDIDRFW